MKHSFSVLISVFAVLGFLVSCGGSEDDSGTSGNTGSIYGVVSDENSGEPLQNATVELFGFSAATKAEYIITSTLTGSDGSFEFLDLETTYTNGGLILKIKKSCYDTKRIQVEITADKETRIDISLSPQC